MGIDAFFKTVSYVLVASGFLTLALTGRIDVPSTLLYAVALVLSWFSDRPGSRLLISARTANMLVVAYLPFAFLDFRYLSGSWIAALIHFTLFVSIFKLFQVKQDRDWVFLYLLAIFEVLLAAGLTVDYLFILTFAVFILTGLATLEVFEIRRTRRGIRPTTGDARAFSHDGTRPRTAVRPVRYLIGVTGLMAVLIVVVAIPIFFVMPRFNTGLLAQGFADSTVSMTGFSDSVTLGDVGRIKQSDQVVMYVKVDGAVPPEGALRWHGVTLSVFDGARWKKAGGGRRLPVTRTGQGHYLIDPRPVPRESVFVQNFYLEPTSTTVVFYAGKPLTITDQLQGVTGDQAGSFYTASATTSQRTAYTVSSDISRPKPELLARDPLRYAPEQAAYLQLPADFSPRIRQLAEEVAGREPNGYAKARAIEQYLQTRYGYTLNLKRTDEPDPIVDFLFNVRAGHCEYFASAMAVMLRSLGVGTRIVNGFQGGEFNPLSSSYTVRQADAHSWVEVYFPESRSWVEFDPTPAAGLSRQPAPGIGLTLGRYIEAMRLFWIDYVVAFDADRQRQLAREAQKTVSTYQSRYRRWIDANRDAQARKLYRLDEAVLSVLRHPRFSTVLWLVVAGVLIFPLLRRLARFTRRWRKTPEDVLASWWVRRLLMPFGAVLARAYPHQSMLLYYAEMQGILARAGLRRARHETPLEFARMVRLPEVIALTEVYNRVRFGGDERVVVDVERLRAMLARVREAVRRR